MTRDRSFWRYNAHLVAAYLGAFVLMTVAVSQCGCNVSTLYKSTASLAVVASAGYKALDAQDAATGSPATIAGCAGWWDASQLALTDGTAVATWPNLTAFGGSSYDLLQPTGGLRPIFKANVVNSQLGVVRFDGVSQNISRAFSMLGPYTVFIAFVANANQVATILDGVNNGTLRLSRGTTYSVSAGGLLIGINPQVWTAWGLQWNALSEASSPQRAADIVVQGNPSYGSTGGITVGSRGDGSSPMSADVGEIVFFDRVLSPADCKRMLNYLRAKWVTQ